jgi:hypothetical protein
LELFYSKFQMRFNYKIVFYFSGLLWIINARFEQNLLDLNIGKSTVMQDFAINF